MQTEPEFEWDTTKAETNFRKHGIRFEVAARVFEDPFHLSVQDRYENGNIAGKPLVMLRGMWSFWWPIRCASKQMLSE
ncbi:hypothetical protein N172_17560 [Pantoea dispersa EGD-AAK13]|jgi:uncharacterized protein|nr:hypothetical protein N172_17560 [Pantoea dispersa EGD-AAK13]